MQMATCPKCKQPIVWYRRADGSLIATDLSPSDSGTVVIVDGIAHVLRGDAIESLIEGSRYRNHLGSCTGKPP